MTKHGHVVGSGAPSDQRFAAGRALVRAESR